MFTPLAELTCVDSRLAGLLAKLGLHRQVDLLFYFPRDYEQPVAITAVSEFADRRRVSFVGQVVELGERITHSGKHMLGVQVETADKAFVRLLWFNQPYRKQDLRPGQRLRATGLLRSTVLNWQMTQPEITLLEPDEEASEQCPKPVYGLTEGLKQWHMRRLMRAALPEIIPQVEEALPTEIRQTLNVPGITWALQAIHFPNHTEDIEQAQRRFKLQELFVLQLAISLQRMERESTDHARPCEPTGKIHSRILNRLGFTLTADQQDAIEAVGRDMAKSIPMNRLLQGDVGSGKTVVAQYAMLLCVAHGFQAALMAPTEVLAQQHARTLERSLAASRVRIALLTGSLTKTQRDQTLAHIAAGEIDLVIGTQALLSSDVVFRDLALVIVDEQHKFGVLQRAKLRTDAAQPHYLVLSATPIPRTIAMTAFGDLDLSTLREKPPGRAAVHTYTIPAEELPAWYKFVNQKLDEGRQAFVIAPRVSEGDTDQAASAIGVHERLRNSQFAHRRVSLLHGRLSGEEKDRVLTDFAAGNIDLLVATTVVEVGIDVPNATVMTILDADRLGLSQLHQLRGRIARGSQPGFLCAVASSGSGAQENSRLSAFQRSDDGFELAELDLQMRGPGDLLGTAQSGLPKLRIADLSTDGPLLELARRVAREVLQQDPALTAPQHARLKQQTLARYGQWMQLSNVG
jgi:ATP-dependent DNA helicase RecG